MTSKFKKRKISLKDRKFNLVYFVDSNKSRSIQFSLRSCLALGFTMVIIVLSCIYGVIWGMTQAQKFAALSNDNKMLRKTLFDYQSRYDGVYAVAYPESEQLAVKPSSVSKTINKAIEYANLPTAKLSQGQNPDQGLKSDPQTTAASSGVQTDDSRIAKKPADPQQLASANADKNVDKNASDLKNKSAGMVSPSSPSVEARANGSGYHDAGVVQGKQQDTKGPSPGSNTKSTGDSVAEKSEIQNHQITEDQVVKINEASKDFEKKSPEIKNTHIEIEGSSLKVKFELFSRPSNTLFTGNIWLSAEFENNGKKVILSSPREVEVSENGTVRNPKQGEKYRVRNFTAKQLSLNINPDQHKAIKKVTIGISDVQGNYRLINVPLSTVNSEKKSMTKRG